MVSESTSIRDIIGENISLSRFAKCMDISRPTLYKYMDAYDSNNIDLIPDNILKVFDTASTKIPKEKLQAYFNEIYANHIRTEERRQRESPVPADIAEIVDGEGLDVKDVDGMIERAERHLKRLQKRDPPDEDEIEKVRKDIRDLEYTREMVEKRQSEDRFVLIFSADWTACIGPEEDDVVDYDDGAETDFPDIDSKFRFYLTRARTGYTLFFFNDEEEDVIKFQLLTGSGEDKTKDVVGTFYPETGMKFVRIPDLFDEDFEDLFRYRIIRSNRGKVLNTAIGKFTV